jgi:heat shock protein HtpX
MDRYHARRALRAARVSSLEEGSLLGGLLLIAAGCAAALITIDPGGIARLLGSAGLAGVITCAASRGLRLYRADAATALPTSVARVRVHHRPNRVLSVITVLLSLGLPLAAAVAAIAVVEWGWLVVIVIALLGSMAAVALWIEKLRRGEPDSRSPVAALELLQRLCIRADMQLPTLVVEGGAVATAWTSRARVHVTRPLLELLDDAELEAVLAHELAHLGRRDAALMEICSAPSHLLLVFAAALRQRAARWVGAVHELPGLEPFVALGVLLHVVLIPPTFVIGWLSRTAVLGMSRSREFAADAAAATLTGRPSALGSALLKLERQHDWTPRADLRQAEPRAVLAIVGRPRSGLGRLFATHPPVAARVKRLEQLEERIHAAATPSRLWQQPSSQP